MDVDGPLKKVNKYKLKFKKKPWITPALQKSISIKNNLLKKIITKSCKGYPRNIHKKVKLHTKIIILKPTGTALKTYGKA